MQHYSIVMYIAAAIMLANGHVQDLRVDVVPIQSRFAAVQNVNVILKYSNAGGDTMSIYKWLLPDAHGLTDPLFEVTRDGERVEYVGPVFKRRAPTADDLILLTPGMTVSAAVQLSTVYNMTQSGNYVIKYKMDADEVLFTTDSMDKPQTRSLNGAQDFVLESAPIVVFAIGRRNLLVEQANANSALTRALTPTFTGCSSSQANTITTGLREAENYANSVMSHLNVQSGSTTRYTTWFGRHSAANFNTLKSHFTKIQSVLRSTTVAFDCGCAAGSSSTYAYVYSTQPYKVYLCNQYWSAPMTGTDSMAGTIIHEVAHFKVVAGTTDHAYGHSAAKSLAVSNPTNALANSDSLQYYAENNPRL
jgi:peptidyl-Lys metalloendopeptidase